MGPLNDEEILELHAAGVSGQLSENRSALLTRTDSGLVGRFQRAADPSDQALLDLNALNAAGTLADGSTPQAIKRQAVVTSRKLSTGARLTPTLSSDFPRQVLPRESQDLPFRGNRQ